MTILSLTCRRPLLATALLIATLARPLAAAPEVKEVIAPDLSTAYFGRDNIQVEVLCGPSDESGPLIDLNTIRPENVTLTLTEAQDSSRSGTVFTPIFADTFGEGPNFYRVSAALEQDAPAR